MFSKISVWIFFNLLPHPRRFSFMGSWFVHWYSVYYERYRQTASRYYKKVSPKTSQAIKELVRRRRRAHDRGVDPLDPEYPTLRDVV